MEIITANILKQEILGTPPFIAVNISLEPLPSREARGRTLFANLREGMEFDFFCRLLFDKF